MHAIFIPYGKRSEVELLLRDMEAQKHVLKIWKGKEEKKIWIQGQIRQMPLGIYEYIFPKEDIDCVLNSLRFDENRYNLERIKIWIIKKAIKCKSIPKYKTTRKYLWMKENVNIIPLGIREDGDITDRDGEYAGWAHEAI